MLSAERIMQRCDALARHSELPGGLTRVFLSRENRAANELVLGWMREAGMQASVDAIGNVVGRYEGQQPPCLMLGSHLDTVRDAGRYDGMLGVVSAIECVAALNERRQRLAFAIEVVGFGDEEGVRFATTMLGSRAIAGALDPAVLKTTDAAGVSIEEALRAFGLDPAGMRDVARKKGSVAAYAELHIEQGPVLEAEGLPVGVVTAINGFSRLRVTLQGEAGHAGTVPMNIRSLYPGKGMNDKSRRDIDRILAIWTSCREKFGKGGALLFGRFSVADAYFAPVVMRFKTYAVELPPAARAYSDAVFALRGVRDWIEGALRETEFVAEDEPYASRHR